MDFDRTWLNVHFYVFCDYRIVLRMKIKSGKVLTRLSQCHCVCFFSAVCHITVFGFGIVQCQQTFLAFRMEKR